MKADFGTIAQRIVRNSLKLTWDDNVRIHATEHVIPLAKEIVKEARRAGADTIFTLDSDDIWYDAMLNLPIEWLQEPSTLRQALHGTMTALVYAGGIEDPGPMKKISGERWRANSEGARATGEPWEDDPVPSVYVGLGAVTETRAKVYGFDFEPWYESVLASMAVSPETMEARAKGIMDRLGGAKEGRLTAPGGTDFRFAFHGSDPTAWIGRLDPVKGKKSTYYQSLPEGSVGIALRQGSGEGKVVSTTPIPYAGEWVRGLSWTFEKGRLTDVHAEENADQMTKRWDDDKRTRGADQLGSLTIGVNPKSRFGFLNDEIVEGAVALNVGDNEDFDGTNASNFTFPLFLADPTLEVDGKPLVVDGVLKL
ncbi:MAG: aminopeptidase [Thermoplasmata archaeon]